MIFLVDECTGPTVAQWLRGQGYDVVSVYDQARGMDDDAVLAWAPNENRILITSDKDFGELVFRETRPHHGVLLLRLNNPNPANHIAAIERILKDASITITDQFVVVTDAGIRIGTP